MLKGEGKPLLHAMLDIIDAREALVTPREGRILNPPELALLLGGAP